MHADIRSIKKLLLLLLMGGIVFSKASSVEAAWDGNQYQPAVTLNPECGPQQKNCTVIPPLVANTGWTTTGNSGTSAGTNFLGTIDDQALVFKTNNTERGRFLTAYTLQLGDGSAGSTIKTSSGQNLNLTADTTGGLTLDSGTTGGVNLGTGANAKTITVGNTTGTTGVTLNSGTSGVTLSAAATTGNAVAITANSSTTGNALVITTTSTSPLGITRTGSGNWITMSYGLTATQNFGMYNTLGTPEGAISANVGSLDTDTASGRVYIKTTSNAVNTGWIELSQTDKAPVGAIVSYGGTSAPSGYLMTDGAAVSRTTYSQLFATIGTAYGSGDGSTTFNLPDLRSRFVRGTDNMGTGAAGRDPNAATRTASNTGGNTGNNVGSAQTDSLQTFGVSTTTNTNLSSGTSFVNNVTTNSSSLAAVDGCCSTPRVTSLNLFFGSESQTASSTSTSAVTGSPNMSPETRPINVYVNFMIKAQDTPAGAASSFMNHINDSTGTTYVRTEQTAGENFLRLGTTGIERLTVDNTGRVGIGTTTPAYALDVLATSISIARFAGTNNTSCTLSSTGIIACTSDATLKHDITPLGTIGTLAKIMQLKPSTFMWNDNDALGLQYGFIAQDVQQVFSNLIATDPTSGKLTFSQIGLIPFIVKGIQEQQLEFAGLQGLAIVTPADYATASLLESNGDTNFIVNTIDYISHKISIGMKIVHELVAERMIAVSGYFKHIVANELCLNTSDGKLVCVTGDQLKGIGATIRTTPTQTPHQETNATGSGEAVEVNPSSTPSPTPPASPDTTSPTTTPHRESGGTP